MTLTSARLQVLAASALFSTGGVAIKAEAFTGMQVSAIRSGIAAIALLLWLRGRVSLSPAILGAGAIYATALTLFVLATKLTTAANAIFLQSAAPLYILILGPLLLRERFHRRDLVYLATVASGVALCFAGQAVPQVTAPDPATGNLLGMLAGLAWALTLIALRYIGRDRPGADVGLSAVITGNLLASVVAIPFALPLPQASAVEWSTLVYLGVFQIGLAYIWLTSAMGRLPALEVSLLLLIEPVLNPTWTWLLRGEEPGRWTIIGGAIILVATAMKSVYDARRPTLATKDTKTV